MLVVSFYTNNGTYPEQARRLAASCDKFGLKFLIKEITDKGSWQNVCNYRPKFLLETLINTREALLWLDCDCEIMSPPTLLYGPSCDFAAYNFSADPDEDVRQWCPYDPNKLLISGGVQYVTYSAPAIEMLYRLNELFVNNPETMETDPIHDLCFNRERIPMKTLWLPKSYNRLSDRWPDIIPVIDHHYKRGASREAKP